GGGGGGRGGWGGRSAAGGGGAGGGGRRVVTGADGDGVGRRRGPGAGEGDGVAGGASASASQPERTLILGWNSRVPAIVTGIDAYVAADSEVLVVSGDPDAAAILEALDEPLRNLTLAHRIADVADRRIIDELDPRVWDHVMVLPPDLIESPTQAD